MLLNSNSVIRELSKNASVEDAVFLQRFFKTGPGQYGEGDVFIGVRMPKIRLVCKQFKDLPLTELRKLVDSEVHEHRMAALIVVSNRFKKADLIERMKLYDFYISALKRGRVNNWDLIDVTCPHVMGEYLLDKPRDIIFELVKSDSLWERRASVLATFVFVKNGETSDSLKIAEILLHDKEDLIHKAVGWMLREIGKQVDDKILTDFLDHYAQEMPRTMLRYAIERLPEEIRKSYLKLRKIKG